MRAIPCPGDPANAKGTIHYIWWSSTKTLTKYSIVSVKYAANGLTVRGLKIAAVFRRSQSAFVSAQVIHHRWRQAVDKWGAAHEKRVAGGTRMKGAPRPGRVVAAASQHDIIIRGNSDGPAHGPPLKTG